MLSAEHRSIFPPMKIKDLLKSSQSGTLSPLTTATTSSGYSTGSSSISPKVMPSLKKSFSASVTSKKGAVVVPQREQQQTIPLEMKNKPKGLQNLFSKLKNLFVTPKNKHEPTLRTMANRRISSSNILRQYHPCQDSALYDFLPTTSLATSKTISLPFTYYHRSTVQSSKTNFEQISAWLNRNEEMTKTIDQSCSSSEEPSLSLSSLELDRQEISVVMKTTPSNIKPPRRSSSLVTKLQRSILEQQTQTNPNITTVERTNSSTSSFSSSILARGMSERITPTPPAPLEKSKSTHHHHHHPRRAMDFSRRKTLATTNEQNANKENLSFKSSVEQPYRFDSSNVKADAQAPTAKHKVTKEYYFHSQTSEDLLNNSYGLTLLQQQKQVSKPLQPRHSVEAVLMISQIPKISSFQPTPIPTRSPPPTAPTLDSLEDLLCDREVESYFYPAPSSFPSEHIYMNLSTPADPYSNFSPSFDYLHGTLC